MKKDITSATQFTIGLDIGDKRSLAVVLDGNGEWHSETTARTTAEAIAEQFASFRGARIVIEVGTHSPWVSRVLEDAGLEVVIANPRRVALIAANHRKTDRVDAEMLARLGRADPQLLAPIVHRHEQAQRDLSVIRLRDGLVRSRTDLVLMVRGTCKTLGTRIPPCSTPAFPKRARAILEVDDLECPGIPEILDSIDELTKRIRNLDKVIEGIAATRYPELAGLTQITGVGTLTALCFMLVIADPGRFASSRDVAAYLGLVPRQRESGESHPQLGITKCGDTYLRSLLIGSAHYILGPFGPDTELRRFGLRLIDRGGPAPKKRAVVAVARKLSILLHRLWVTGEVYAPVGYRADGSHLLDEHLAAAA